MGQKDARGSTLTGHKKTRGSINPLFKCLVAPICTWYNRYALRSGVKVTNCRSRRKDIPLNRCYKQVVRTRLGHCLNAACTTVRFSSNRVVIRHKTPQCWFETVRLSRRTWFVIGFLTRESFRRNPVRRVIFARRSLCRQKQRFRKQIVKTNNYRVCSDLGAGSSYCRVLRKNIPL